MESRILYNIVRKKGAVKVKKICIKIMALFALVAALICAFTFASFAADSFEKQISAFPESYRVYLRVLHKKYPDWKFNCVNTGLDWYDAVENESALERSAVPKAASSLCKNHDSGYYNPSTGTYKETDAGWNDASPDTVAYFLDPRNFLNEENIFQFELLTFSSLIKVSDVEQILKGTFMYDAKIKYYTSDGTLKKTSTKYSQCIYDAGKASNLNPCYLASKIKNEVVSGTQASGSVSGKYSGYEGYYNFYNIGAYAGKSPIANGLKYASTAGTYSRPWNTPQKAISGGAQWIAEQYVARGQNTGYFQKFNVGPNTVSAAYNHQYMSNVSGAQSQGKSTYLSYSVDGLLNRAITFSIPVFKNMPGADGQMKNFSLFDSYNQTANPTTTLNVREEPNVNAKFVVSVRPETTVTVKSKCRNNLCNYYQQLYYPYWYQISFKQDGKSYTGYAVADYLEPAISLSLNKGSTIELPVKSTGAEKPTLYTWDTSVISVTSDFKVKGLKNGTAYLTATTSLGGYDYIKIKVGSYSSTDLAVKNFSVSPTESGIKLSWSKVNSASGYEIIVSCAGKSVHTASVSSSTTSLSVSSLNVNNTYSAKIRAFKKASTSKLNGAFSSLGEIHIAPVKVSGLFCEKISNSSFTLRWTPVTGADGYEILRYNSADKKYEPLKKVTTAYCTFSSLSAGQSSLYKVRAYVKQSGTYIYGSESDEVEGYTYKATMKPPTKMTVKKTKISVVWSAAKSADKYILYKFNSVSGRYVKCGETDKNSYIFSSLNSGQSYNVMVEAVSTTSGAVNKLAGVEFVIKTLPKKITGVKQTDSTGYKINVSWKKASGASSYRVYKRNSSTGKYEFCGETKTNSYLLSGLSPLSSARVKVRAVVTNTTGNSFGESSDSVLLYTGAKKPTGLKATYITSTSVSLKWKKPSGAQSYNVYSVDGDGKTKLLLSSDTTECTVSSLESGKKYKFKVESVVLKDGKWITGSISSSLKVSTAPAGVKGLSSSGHTTKRYTLTWDTVSGADGYFVYRRNSKTKAYIKVSDVTANKITYKDLYSAKKDTYRICAYVIYGGVKYEGAPSDSLTVSTLPKNPTSLNVKKQSGGSLSLSWKGASRASGYTVSVYDVKSSKWISLGNTSGTAFTVSADKLTGKDSVKVQTYVTAGSANYTSDGITAQILK